MERSIILKPWEASAFAEGRATALLRVMTPQPVPAAYSGLQFGDGSRARPFTKVKPGAELNHSPFGAPGNVLLGRETWAPADILIKAYEKDDPEAVAYRANHVALMWDGKAMGVPLDTCCVPWERFKWRSSTSMPAWAVRTRLVIERVRVVQWSELQEPHGLAYRPSYQPHADPGTWCWLIETRRDAA